MRRPEDIDGESSGESDGGDRMAEGVTTPPRMLQRNQKLLLQVASLLLCACAGLRLLLPRCLEPTSGRPWGEAGAQPSSEPVGESTLGSWSQRLTGEVPRRDQTGVMKVVHLDMKGAAPRVSYLEQLFPLLSRLGADAVLIEYEDMFPFHGELELLRSPHSYSKHDIERIQQLAAQNHLEVIPLVQTFGHFEFVLKHEKFWPLREVDRYPSTLNPHAAGTMPLLRALLGQVLDQHPHTRWLHVGADEVFHLGEGADSRAWLLRHGEDVGHMYLNHVREVVTFLSWRHPGLRLLLWDDVLRRLPPQAVQESGIPQLADPMMWFYDPDLDTDQIGRIIAKYAESGFRSVWFASSFKGSTGPAQMWTPLSHHLSNQLSWLRVLRALQAASAGPHIRDARPIRCQGIVLTGWQRYDHYSVLCELLPVAVPSLAICLQTLVAGEFTEVTKKTVMELLGFQTINLESSTCQGDGMFPGAEVYQLVEQVKDLKETGLRALEEDSTAQGWFSPYHRKHRFGNPQNLEAFGRKLTKVSEAWESLLPTLQMHLGVVFYSNTVDEWLEEYVLPQLEPLRAMVRDYQDLVQLKGKPGGARPGEVVLNPPVMPTPVPGFRGPRSRRESPGDGSFGG
ncbi:hexosaminidase D-like isoform X1 [Petaurus breviceps papuanus]|uniref:hexosaminidase D-like isoform X1 n=1 Tax=Petaurus breviceps papuanus TaxID=3040969 RepID=UPI0036DAB021